MNRYAFVIPVYRHGSTLDEVIASLAKYGYPVIVVDDGNMGVDVELIHSAAEKYSFVSLITLKKNSGKGKAVSSGMLKAQKLGATHAFQVDSDGQHDLSQIPFFIEEAEKNPNAVIAGFPEYDSSVPRHRLIGRKIANFWIRIVTMSNEIKDALIGFRIYPVEEYCRVLKKHAIIDSRMGFDIDIIVHLSWRGLRVISCPVKIFYPKDGISNFRNVRDNVRISLVYARLFIGMIFRFFVLLSRLLKRRCNG